QSAGDADPEQIRVTGYGTTADTITVTRGLSGTNKAYGTDVIVIGVGTSLAEGSDPEAARSVDRVESSNVCQIFGPTSVHMSATEQLVAKYGVANEWAHQLYKRTRENAISREQAYLYGIKYYSTTSKVRTTGGIRNFLVTNVEATDTGLTLVSISDQQQACYNQGGSPDRLMANPIVFKELTDVTN